MLSENKASTANTTTTTTNGYGKPTTATSTTDNKPPPPENMLGSALPANPEMAKKFPISKSPSYKPFFTKQQLEQFHQDGFIMVKAKDMWSSSQLKSLLDAVNAMDTWEEKAGAHMMYFEKNLKNPTGPKILCRVENFLQYVPPLNELFNGERILCMVGELFGERAIMHKEKINHKLPGGDGFKPHQDVAAGWWMYGQTLHISALVSIDEATMANGALELVKGRHKEGLLGEPWKEVPDQLVKTMKWEGYETQPGDVVFFDSFVPHRSGPNLSDKRRRVAYLTYGKASEGDWRDKYFADKRKSFPPDIEREQGKVYEYKI